MGFKVWTLGFMVAAVVSMVMWRGLVCVFIFLLDGLHGSHPGICVCVPPWGVANLHGAAQVGGKFFHRSGIRDESQCAYGGLCAEHCYPSASLFRELWFTSLELAYLNTDIKGILWVQYKLSPNGSTCGILFFHNFPIKRKNLDYSEALSE